MHSSPNKVTILYHIGYRFPQDASLVHPLFRNVRVVLLCGTFSRAEKLSLCFGAGVCNNLSRTDRFKILLPNPSVLIASHGIGLGSIDCLLNDVHHLLAAATVSNYCFLRVGSSGGIGVPQGTIVVTRDALNGELKPELPLTVLGRVRFLPAKLDETLSQTLVAYVKGHSTLHCVWGDTLCAETFFDTQARTDGVDPLFSEEEAHDYLKHCREKGVKNIEMESLPLATFANRVGVPAVVACVTFVDRLLEDTPSEDIMKLLTYESRAVNVIVDFVKETFVSSQVTPISAYSENQ